MPLRFIRGERVRFALVLRRFFAGIAWHMLTNSTSRSPKVRFGPMLDFARRMRTFVPAMVEFQRLLWGIGILMLSVILGTVGYMADGWNFSDALFMVMITVSTVGYGEVRPLDSDWLRLLTSMVLILGLVGNALMIAAAAEIVISRSLRAAFGRFNLQRTIADMSDHVIIVGYGRMGKQTAERLTHSGAQCVIVESEPATIAQLARTELLYLQGDGMAESTLIDAGIERASSILCLLNNDVDNVYVTLSARQLNPTIRIISKAEQQTSLRKLYQAGANHVVSPSTMGAMRVSNLVVNPLFAELIDAMNIGYGSTQIQMHEVRADQYPEMIDVEYQAIRTTFVDLQAVVVGIRHSTGRVSFPPPLDHRMASGDSLIMLIRYADMKACDETVHEKLKALKRQIDGDETVEVV